LHPDFRLGLIIRVDHFNRQSAQLAPVMIKPELERILHVVADCSRRAGKGRDEPDLDGFVLRQRLPGGQRQHGSRGNPYFRHLIPSSGRRWPVRQSMSKYSRCSHSLTSA
jgi:hypothetical protein